MKQFTEAELAKVKDDQWDDGFSEGYAVGLNIGSNQHRAKLANQRKELRRLNAKLSAMYDGIRLVKYQDIRLVKVSGIQI